MPHLAYVIGWLVTAALVALSVARPSHAARLGALFGLGIGAVTFGLFLADIGQLDRGVSLGSGLVVSLLGWAACTAGSALALVANPGQAAPQAQPGLAADQAQQPRLSQTWLSQPGSADQAQPAQAQPTRLEQTSGSAGRPGDAGPGWPAGPAGWQAQPRGSPRAAQASRPVRPTLAHAGPLALLVLAAIGTAAAFAPSWDRYTIVSAATNTSQTVTAGNAFDNPGLVIAGNVAVMVAIVVVAAVAALWRPARHGGWLLAGAIVPAGRRGGLGVDPGGPGPVGRDVRPLVGPGGRGRADVHLRTDGGVLGVPRLRGFPARLVRLAVHRAALPGRAGLRGVPVAPG